MACLSMQRRADRLTARVLLLTLCLPLAALAILAAPLVGGLLTGDELLLTAGLALAVIVALPGLQVLPALLRGRDEAAPPEPAQEPALLELVAQVAASLGAPP